MKAKIFEVVPHKLRSGKSPAAAPEEQINQFLVQHPDLKLVSTHMSTLVSPAEPNAMPERRNHTSPFFAPCSIPTGGQE